MALSAALAALALAVVPGARAQAWPPAPDGQATPCVVESFDSVTPPALPAGWTAWNAVGGGSLWTTVAGNSDTYPNSVSVATPSEVADKRLESPPIPIMSSGAILSFRQSFDFRISVTTIDGGVLEVATDDGAFHDITEDAAFLQGGYNGIPGGPLDGRQAWIGSSSGWSQVVVDLGSSLAGHTARFRWRLGAGGGGPLASSWFLDSMEIVQSCGVKPLAVRVDEQVLPTVASSALQNGILEPGETVVIDPLYQATGQNGVLLSGTATAFTGPGGIPYTIVDSAADYGGIAAGAVGDCFLATGNCYLVSVGATSDRFASHWDADLAESLSSGAVRHWKLHIGETFSDVPPAHPFYRFVETILHDGISVGCGSNTDYCPEEATTRQQMAVFVLRSKFGAWYAPPPCSGVFLDVACPGHITDWIEDLHARGIVAGCGPGPTYCPGAPVTRQQMAVFLLKTFQGGDYVPPACAGVFTDVPCTSPFAAWIEDLANRHITGGCGGGAYCPGHPTTRGQMAVFLVKTFGLTLYGP